MSGKAGFRPDPMASHRVDDGSSYRVAVKNNHEDGMVEFLKAGAVLNGEFFTESEFRKKFSDPASYRCFLATRKIDHVVLSGEYPQRFYGPERKQLDGLVKLGIAEQEYLGSDGTVAYRVRPPASDARSSVRDCGI